LAECVGPFPTKKEASDAARQRRAGMDDHALLLAIQEELDGVEWDSDTLERVAQLMVASGYRIRDCNDVDREG
jgi:hypothetical protein